MHISVHARARFHAGQSCLTHAQLPGACTHIVEFAAQQALHFRRYLGAGVQDLLLQEVHLGVQAREVEAQHHVRRGLGSPRGRSADATPNLVFWG